MGRRVYKFILTAVMAMSVMASATADGMLKRAKVLGNIHRPLSVSSAYANKVHNHPVQPVRPARHGVRIRDVELIVEDKNDTQIANNELLRSYVKGLLDAGGDQKVIERYLMLIDKIPGYEMEHATRNPIQEADGSTSEEMVIAIKRFGGKLRFDVDNFGNSNIGKYQFAAFAQAANLFGANESIIVSGATSNKPNALRILAAGVLKRLNSHGTSVNFLFSYLKDNPFINSSPGSSDKSFTYKGEIEHYFLLNNTNTLKLELSLEHRHTKHQVHVGGTGSNYSYNMLNHTIKARHRDRFGGDNSLLWSFRQGMNTKVRSYDSLGVFDTDFNYTVLDLTRDQPLFGDFSAFMRATFHYAPGLLPMEQQFAVGTNLVGQGYPTGLISGNKGINALLELRYTRELDNNRWLRGIQPYLFFDCAKVSSPIQPISKRLLNSAGAGVRLMTPFNLTASFGVAVPFTKRVVLDNKDVITNKVKVTFELSKEFRF